jgi:hypothetical protein
MQKTLTIALSLVVLSGCVVTDELSREFDKFSADISREFNSIGKTAYYVPMVGAKTDIPLAQVEAQCRISGGKDLDAYDRQTQRELNDRYRPLAPSYQTDATCIKTGFTYQCSGTTTGGVNPLVQAVQNGARGQQEAIANMGRGTAYRRAFENCMNSKGFEKKYR